jgi:hypothetical protein
VRRPASFALALAITSLTATARPQDPASEARTTAAEPPVEIAIVAGAVTGLVPMILGGIHTAAQSPTADGPRNVGLAVAGVGPVLAPVVAHVVLGEYRRAALFGALPAAAEIGTCIYLAAIPDSVFEGTKETRLGFALLYTADLLGGVIGLVDAMMVRERARLTRRRGPDLLGRITVSPRAGAGHRGLVIGGVF